MEPAVSPKQGSPSLPFPLENMHSLSSYINLKVYHAFSQGAPKATPQIVYSFDTFDIPVKDFATMNGRNAECLPDNSQILSNISVKPCSSNLMTSFVKTAPVYVLK